MKNIILLTAAFFSLAFTRPAHSEDILILMSGYFAAVEHVQFVGNRIIVDGTGSGYSTLGSFTATHHSEIHIVTGQ